MRSKNEAQRAGGGEGRSFAAALCKPQRLDGTLLAAESVTPSLAIDAVPACASNSVDNLSACWDMALTEDENVEFLGCCEYTTLYRL